MMRSVKEMDVDPTSTRSNARGTCGPLLSVDPLRPLRDHRPMRPVFAPTVIER
jgi:hypothetical protein